MQDSKQMLFTEQNIKNSFLAKVLWLPDAILMGYRTAEGLGRAPRTGTQWKADGFHRTTGSPPVLEGTHTNP